MALCRRQQQSRRRQNSAPASTVAAHSAVQVCSAKHARICSCAAGAPAGFELPPNTYHKPAPTTATPAPRSSELGPPAAAAAAAAPPAQKVRATGPADCANIGSCRPRRRLARTAPAPQSARRPRDRLCARARLPPPLALPAGRGRAAIAVVRPRPVLAPPFLCHVCPPPRTSSHWPAQPSISFLTSLPAGPATRSARLWSTVTSQICVCTRRQRQGMLFDPAQPTTALKIGFAPTA